MNSNLAFFVIGVLITNIIWSICVYRFADYIQKNYKKEAKANTEQLG